MFLHPAAASTEPPSACVPGSGCPPVPTRHTQPALKVTGGLEHLQWSYRSEKGRGIHSCFCLMLCPCASFGQRQAVHAPVHELQWKDEGCETGVLAPRSHFISVKSKHCNNHRCTVKLNTDYCHQPHGFQSILDTYLLWLHPQGSCCRADVWQKELFAAPTMTSCPLGLWWLLKSNVTSQLLLVLARVHLEHSKPGI